MRHTFEAEQWLPYPLELMFAFFANPENLPRLMPAWQKARIEEAMFAAPPPRPAEVPRFPGVVAGAGTKMTISFKPFPYAPMRVPWDAEITEFAWNDHFCDIQTRGPFAYWKHCHRLQVETRDGVAGTQVQDRVEYEMRLGPVGELGHRLFAAKQIAGIFAYRQRLTAELMGLIWAQIELGGNRGR